MRTSLPALFLTLLWLTAALSPAASLLEREAEFYQIETISLPPEVILEVGGMAYLDDGTLLITTRHSEIWSFKDRQWKRWAFGLDEPLGITRTGPRQVVVAQRPELTRITDTDGDGQADLFETITDAWNYSGHIYEWTFGPVQDSAGNFYGTLTCWFFPHKKIEPNPFSGWEIPPPPGYKPRGDAAWRGFSFKVTSSGEFIPYSSGLRSPNGIGLSPDGELFVSDNQGEYYGACVIHHVTEGAFHGHPNSLFWDEPKSDNPFSIPLEQLEPRRKLPAIILPFGVMGQSASEPLWDRTGGKFGPFDGQMFIGDQTKATVMRVALEKVNGRYQGAAFPFRSGFQSGNNRLLFEPSGSLLVGQTDRGWGAIGGKRYGLQRLSWTGKVPFEIDSMQLAKKGFNLKFTKPLDSASQTNISAFHVQRYRYEYHRKYGSPQVEKNPVEITALQSSSDATSIFLTLRELKPGLVYEISINDLRAHDGSELLHDTAYYTLNYLLEPSVTITDGKESGGVR